MVDKNGNVILETHPDVAHLGFLLGTWSGSGVGEYPTIEPFRYDETITISHVGKPYLAYVQRTTLSPGGQLSHAETGFLRPAGPRRVELVLAHPNGLVELSEGSLVETSIRLASRAVLGTSTAKDVMSVERDIDVDLQDRLLRYELRMAAVGHAVGRHLVGELRRS